jgi:hypothetical protein
MPPVPVTAISTAPGVPAGVSQVSVVEFVTETFVAETPPNLTEVTPVKFVPVTVTESPPAVLPVFGEQPVTVGAATYVYRVFAEFVPPTVVTVTLAVPAEPAGVVHVIVVELTTVTPVAATPSNLTEDAPVRLVPVIVTDCPPAVGPELGDTPETVGAAT